MTNLSRSLIRGVGLLGVASLAVTGVLLAQVREEDKARAGQVQRPQAPKDKEDANQRSVEGTVMGAGSVPVEGAIVQLKDMRTLTIRSFRTPADGKYRFAALRTDTDYELKAVLGETSSSTKRVSSFDSRKLATVNLELEKK